MAEEFPVFGCGESDARDWFTRDDQNMDGCLWRYVAKCDAVIILKDDVGRDFSRSYFFKKCLIIHGVSIRAFA